MKKGVAVVCLMMTILASTFGCGKSNATKAKPSDEELAKASTVCGVVREITDEKIKVQLCGNYVIAEKGNCYIDILNEYGTMQEDDSVLLYYTGDLKTKTVEDYVEAYNIDVCYMETYDNDGQFVAHMSIPNGMISDEDTELVSRTVLTPVDGEPEKQFQAVLGVTYFLNGQLDKDKPAERSDVIFDVEDEWGEVTVTYDIDTMEVISIIQ